MYFYFTCNKFASIVLFQTSVHLKVIFNEIGCTHTIKSKYSWFFNTNQCHAYQFPIKFYLIIRWNFIWKSCKLMNGYSNINNHKQNCEPLFEFISEHFQHGTITIQVVFERKWKKNMLNSWKFGFRLKRRLFECCNNGKNIQFTFSSEDFSFAWNSNSIFMELYELDFLNLEFINLDLGVKHFSRTFSQHLCHEA